MTGFARRCITYMLYKNTRNLGGFILIERPMFQNLGVHFLLYRNNGANIDEIYHKSMYDP